MNERIRQLASEASDQTDWWDVSYPFIDKFAELIIKECANIADKAEPYKASDLIRKHFGIEE